MCNAMQGNQHYREKNLHGAKDSYYRAAWIMEYCACKDREEELQRGNILIKLRSNLAQVDTFCNHLSMVHTASCFNVAFLPYFVGNIQGCKNIYIYNMCVYVCIYVCSILLQPCTLQESCYYSDLSSESGTVFEVSREPLSDHHTQQKQANFFDDVSLISSLTLGGGMYDEYESKCDFIRTFIYSFRVVGFAQCQYHGVVLAL